MKDRNTTTFVCNALTGVLIRLRSTRLVVAATALLVLATASHAWGQNELLKVLASDAEAGDKFGMAVSISGDTAIVGAWLDNHGVPELSDAGSAYIFQQDFQGQLWGEVKKLTALDAAASDFFGRSVSISGDIAIVASPFDDDTGSLSGSAYIFYRNAGDLNQWNQVAKLTADDAVEGHLFGSSVSISGDFAIVGATGDADAGASSGSAYIFYRNSPSDDQWGQVAKLTAMDATAGDYFGGSVSISGDTAIVGAPRNDDNCPGNPNCDSGSAYIFIKLPGGWMDMTENHKLTASDMDEGDRFGNSVSISGDLAIVGAVDDNDTGSDSGSAYIFDRNDPSNDEWGQQAKLTVSDGAINDKFGISVSISGDVAVVGAYLDDDNGSDSGSAHIFWEPWPSDTDGWGRVGKLTASDGAANDIFGMSVSISRDVAIIGGPQDDDGGSDSGSAYIFDPACPCPWDLDGDGDVDIFDLLALLAAWGTNPGGPPDFDGNGDVDILDLLTLVAKWGNCPCVVASPSRSLDDELADAGLSQADWDAFKECMSSGTQAEQDNCLCWMQYYLDGCDGGTRQACSDHDPFTDCVGDLNGDCCVDQLDTQILLNQLGPCPAGPGACLGDLNGDCVVDRLDHSDLLTHFGACPGTQYCPSAPPGCGTTTTEGLQEAVTLMGFAEVTDYQAHIVAVSEGEAFVCACVLQVLLEAQP